MALLLLIPYVAGLVQTVLDARKAEPARKSGVLVAAELKHQSSPGEKKPDVVKVVIAFAVSSLLIALLADYVTDSVNAVKSRFGLTDLFLGVILIAAIGNISSQMSAASMAMKNKMDVAFEIGMSSGTQMALLVIPILVLMSHLYGKPVNLEFTLPEVVALGAGALLTT